jgi:hypothetical protein
VGLISFYSLSLYIYIFLQYWGRIQDLTHARQALSPMSLTPSCAVLLVFWDFCLFVCLLVFEETGACKAGALLLEPHLQSCVFFVRRGYKLTLPKLASNLSSSCFQLVSKPGL